MINDAMESVKVLRAVRIPVNPDIESCGMRLESIDIFEVETIRGTTVVLGRTIRAAGSFDPEADPCGPVFWHGAHSTFEEAVENNVNKESGRGTLAGDPVTLAPNGSAVTENVPVRLLKV